MLQTRWVTAFYILFIFIILLFTEGFYSLGIEDVLTSWILQGFAAL